MKRLTNQSLAEAPHQIRQASVSAAAPSAVVDADRSTYAGIFFVALATLMYEILLTRIFSVTMLYHFAFVALSLAMFGMTAGALAVYLAPNVFTTDRVRSQLALAAIAFPITIVLSFLTQLSVPFRVHPSIVAIYAIAFTYVVIAVPFVVSGIVVCLALTRFPQRVSRLYAADLAGAALGCVLLIAVIGYSDGPTAVLWVAVLASIGATLFARRAPRAVWWTAVVTASLLTLAAAGSTAFVWRGFPIFRILYIKGSLEARPLYEKWNSYSRVRVNGSETRFEPPQGWGLSTALPESSRVRQMQMDIDVGAGTVLTGFTGDLQGIQHLTYDVTNIAYYVRPEPRVLVIGAGGGRDILSALVFNAKDVTAVEINKDIIRTVNGRFGEFTGHLDRNPRVRFVNDEARSYIARSAERFDLIQISLIDTWAATAAGAFVLSENSLYTVEAWTTFLRHLTDDGMLSVSRWYFRDRPAEMYRTTSLAVEALRRLGIDDPRGHIAIVRNMQLANRPADTPDGVGTILVSRRPFTAAELDVIDRETGRLAFDVPFSPRAAADDTYVRLTTPAGLAEFLQTYPINVTAPTDNSPFFFNMLRLRDVVTKPELLEFGKLSLNMKAVATLAVLLVTVTFLTAACILLPLWLTRDRVNLAGAGPLFTFFIAIGLGFMLIETSQMQRLIIALGHPTYGLSVVLFALLLSSGIGSFLTSGVTDAAAPKAGRRRLLAAVAVLGIFGLITPAVAAWIEPMTTVVRIAVAIVLLFPAGLMMGMAFPLGMKLAARRAGDLTAWFWGLNGAASVLASVVSVCIALTWSISAAFWTGWLCYVLAFWSISRAAGEAARA
ncbi:MAG TPA: hypothetical protein VFJ02_14980 [Vicinamibacterales bacterium]|nr:hypothetical protein [Vicinamibacterales bacterium]